MPGSSPLQVKCEPPSDSDEDDSNSQFVPYRPHQVPSPTEFRPIKSEAGSTTVPSRKDVMPTSFLQNLQEPPSLEELGGPAPAAPAATPVCVKQEPLHAAGAGATSLETLEPAPHASAARPLSLSPSVLRAEFMPLLTVKDEPSSEGEQQHFSGSDTSDSCGPAESRGSPKSWTQRDMENALDALKTQNMSLTKASALYGIPSTTLWQRAHRLGIDTPKKEGSSKSWSEADLRGALQALRAGAISANKASKAYGIPSSTLYKIARREGIRLAAPFNAAPTTWRAADLARALHAIREGHASVQRASAQFGIPTGTLYGRCKREGIELSRSNPTPWSEDAMGEALEAVRVGQMSINQAAIHYNLPYSSLYGRFKRCKYPHLQIPQEVHQPPHPELTETDPPPPDPYQPYPLAGELHPPELAHYQQHHTPLQDLTQVPAEAPDPGLHLDAASEQFAMYYSHSYTHSPGYSHSHNYNHGLAQGHGQEVAS